MFSIKPSYIATCLIRNSLTTSFRRSGRRQRSLSRQEPVNVVERLQLSMKEKVFVGE
jgi:hypothetical protein